MTSTSPADPWFPVDADELAALQERLARRAREVLDADPWAPAERPVVGGCFVAFARGEAGPGKPGDRAWAAAVAWQPAGDGSVRRGDLHLRGAGRDGGPRQADDVLAQAAVHQRVPAPYAPGLLAAREGRILAAAVAALGLRPDVLLVDATGLDHPRGAGLALHLGAALELPTVGVTHRPLVAAGVPPPLRRGASAAVWRDGREAGRWVCTRTGARAVVAHAAWRTSPETAASTVVAASTEAARTPVPLQEARRAAREARAQAGAG